MKINNLEFKNKQIKAIKRRNLFLFDLSNEFKAILIFTLLHIPLGFILYNTGFLALLHPLFIIFLGLYCASRREINMEWVALIISYIIGSEVLWRMAQIPVFWETGKYASALIMIVALIKRQKTKIPTLALIYFILLIPSAVLTFVSTDFSDSRDKVSFNLSGPLLLLISCWFFSNIKLTHLQIKRLFLILIIPLLSIGFTTLFYTVTNSDIKFDTESNFQTSGGFGPNQVSSILGLGAFIGLTCFVLFKNTNKYNIFLFAVIIFITAQSVMTFSRGGMYNAIGAFFIVVLFQGQNISLIIKRLIPIILAAGIFLLLVFPILNNFTGGKLQERFQETETTGRTEIIESDIEILEENPVFGVGVGVSQDYRTKFMDHRATSHTEFSRLIADHGSFGIMALACLLLILVINFNRQKSSFGRSFAAGMFMWSSLFMLNAGMRLAAPAFIIGLTFITIVPTRELNSKIR